MTRVIPPRGNTGPTPDYAFATAFTYFGTGAEAGLLQSVTDPLGNETTYEYDAVGRRTSMVDPNGNAPGGVPADHTWSYEYDAEDRVRFVHAPAPVSGGTLLTTEFRYDPVGNRTVVIDANGQVTAYVYDERDSLDEVHQTAETWTDPIVIPPGLIITAYQYDKTGNLSRVTRASGDLLNERVTDYVYDGLNRLRAETQHPSWPLTTPTLVTSYGYDQNSNRTSLLDPLGQTTSYGYDAVNRLTSIGYSDPGTPDVSYQYDANGNRTDMEDGTGSTSYSYDELDRLLAITSPGSNVVGYRYDLDGNRTKLIYPDATSVTYTFDTASRLGSLTDWASRVTSYTYRPDGSVETGTLPNTTVAAFAYDNALRLTEVSNQLGASVISRHTYTLDQVGNRAQLAEILAQVGGAGPALLWGWGGNGSGRVGDGTSTDRLTAVAIGGFRPAVSVAAGGHTLGWKLDGTAWGWGPGTDGRLGNGDTAQRHAPTTVSGLTGVLEVSAGASHSLAVKGDGTAWAWGNNGQGRLGDGTTTDRLTPVQVVGLTGVTAVSAGESHSLALKNDGTVWAWGNNAQGRLGDGTTTDRLTPVQVLSLTDVVAIAAGGAHSMALKSDGTVWAWGANGSGQLGDGTTTNRLTPVQVLTLTGMTAIAAGDVHSLAVKNDGTAWAWGSNGQGRLGDGPTTERHTPVQVVGLTGAQMVAAGTSHSLALKTDGTAWAWGNNARGRLGDGTTTDRLTPVQVAGVSSIATIAAGATHSLASTTGGGSGPIDQTLDYGYDRLYRLISATFPGGGVTTYGYDLVGNRLSMIRGTPTAYTYDRADRILTAGATPYVVNANGNTTGRGADTFGYDQANRLVSAMVGLVASGYSYDGDGKRASKTVVATTTSFVYDVNRSLPVVLDDGSRKYVWGLGLAYAVDKTTDLILAYHTDGLGSVRAITDVAGNVIETYQMDEFGVATATAGSITQPFEYTGEQRDSETGFTYLRARMYEPNVGRFVQRDPLGGIVATPVTLNRYTYVLNNSTSATDPSGLLAFPPRVLLPYGAGIDAPSPVFISLDSALSIENEPPPPVRGPLPVPPSSATPSPPTPEPTIVPAAPAPIVPSTPTLPPVHPCEYNPRIDIHTIECELLRNLERLNRLIDAQPRDWRRMPSYGPPRG